MKIAVVSGFPPSRENIKAPTALPYWLLQLVPRQAEVHLFYSILDPNFRAVFEADIAELPLASAQVTVPPSEITRKLHAWSVKRRKLPGSVARFPVIGSVLRQIKTLKPDLIWLYPYWLIDWAVQFDSFNVVVTGPDSASLLFERSVAFGAWSNEADLLQQRAMVERNRRLEKAWGQTNARLHLLGRRDRETFSAATGRCEQAVFIPHPHFSTIPSEIRLTQASTKIVVSVTGGADRFYAGDHLNRVIGSLVRNAKKLRDRYCFKFIGSGYELVTRDLQSAGYEANVANWVQDFASTIAGSQIQVFPIAVGAGTKAKVLNALASGLLGIGSSLAFENVAVDPTADAVVYTEPEAVASILVQVANNLPTFDAMAQRARAKVLARHSPESISKNFWDWALNS